MEVVKIFIHTPTALEVTEAIYRLDQNKVHKLADPSADKLVTTDGTGGLINSGRELTDFFDGTSAALNALALAGYPPSWYIQTQPNLLINGDLRKDMVINQLGAIEHTGNGYCFDCWRSYISGCATILTNDGVKITVTADVTSDCTPFMQLIEDGKQLTGRQLTLTFYVSEVQGNYFCATARLGKGVNNAFVGFAKSKLISGTGDFTWAFAMPDDADTIRVGIFAEIGTNAGDYITLRAAKLEVGDHFTGWCPATKQQELARCQRYGFAIDAFQRFRASRITANQIDFVVPCPVPLRTIPSLPNNLSVVNLAGVGQQGYTISITSIRSGIMIIRATKTNHGLSDAMLQMGPDNLSFFDARL